MQDTHVRTYVHIWQLKQSKLKLKLSFYHLLLPSQGTTVYDRPGKHADIRKHGSIMRNAEIELTGQGLHGRSSGVVPAAVLSSEK
jgi:hypothetical protein